MIRALLIYAAAIVAFIVAGTVATGTPLVQVAWLVLLVEVVPLATWGAAMSIRRMSRPKRRGDLQYLGADHVDRLPRPSAVAEIVTEGVDHMAQWDGVGDVNDWAEYLAGERSAPPAAQLDANSRRAALEQAAVIAKVRQDRARKLVEYVTRNGVRL